MGTRSYSQISSYEECPYGFYLKRIKKVWERPAFWFPHGTAVHKAQEEWELSGRMMDLASAQDVFRKSYASEIARYADTTPNFDYWFPSGQYRGAVDAERRYHIGLTMVAAYIDYYLNIAPNEKPWVTPDGRLAIELPFNMTLNGVKIRGYVDGVYVIEHRDGRIEIRVRDVKTGQKPGTVVQLATYAIGMYKEHGVVIKTGDFHMGKTGKPSPARKPHDLTDWTEERLGAKYAEIDALIEAQVFDPKPEPSKCGRCSVATSCPFSAA